MAIRFFPDSTYIKNGSMEFMVQQAMDLGFDPIATIQMDPLNPAEHFRLDRYWGDQGESFRFVKETDIRHLLAISKGRADEWSVSARSLEEGCRIRC